MDAFDVKKLNINSQAFELESFIFAITSSISSGNTCFKASFLFLKKNSYCFKYSSFVISTVIEPKNLSIFVKVFA